MKPLLSFLLTAVIALGLAVPVRAQTNAVSTNSPTIASGVDEVIQAFKSGATNWWFEGHGLYAPSLHSKWGGGVGAFWNVSQYVYTGIRVDYVNNHFWTPSGSATFQVPMKLTSWLVVSPLGYAGIGIPISGAQVNGVNLGTAPNDNDGQPTAILGYGAAVHLFTNHNPTAPWYQPHSWDLLYDRETWSGFSGTQQRLGLGINFNFPAQ